MFTQSVAVAFISSGGVPEGTFVQGNWSVVYVMIGRNM